MKYSKEEAIELANDFINDIRELEKKYNMKITSDSDIFLCFNTIEKNKFRDYVRLGWVGDGSPIKVIDKIAK